MIVVLKKIFVQDVMFDEVFQEIETVSAQVLEVEFDVSLVLILENFVIFLGCVGSLRYQKFRKLGQISRHDHIFHTGSCLSTMPSSTDYLSSMSIFADLIGKVAIEQTIVRLLDLHTPLEFWLIFWLCLKIIFRLFQLHVLLENFLLASCGEFVPDGLRIQFKPNHIDQTACLRYSIQNV
jgi:hypothetical protein